MKLLLVRPHAYLPTAKWLQSMIRLEPYSLELIAGGVPREHDVQICDLAIPADPVKTFHEKLQEYKPDIVGFTGFSCQFRVNRDLARIVRKLRPEAITVLGGIHPSSMPAGCKFPELFDLIVRGDGVSAVKEILRSLTEQGSLPESECLLPTASPTFDEWAAMPPPPLHMDSITVAPRRDLVNMNDYFCLSYGRQGEKMKTLFPAIACVRTSVGCPNRCSFCVVHFLANGKYLQREAETVVDEIAALEQDYIYFVDDETFINTRRMRKIAELLIERGVKKRYLSWARSDTICRDPDLFRLWKQAGLELVYVGFESLTDENLKEYNKKASPSQNRQAREILRDIGLNVHAALMVNPDFEKKDFETVQKAIREFAPAEFAFTVLSPPPGTPSFNEAKGTYICPEPVDYYDCIHTILPTKLPLKRFYKYFSILYALGAWYNPARTNRLKVPLKDRLRFLFQGARFGWRLMSLHRRYDRKYW